MKIRHRIMLWVAGAGLSTSLVFSLVVFGAMWEQPLKMTDAQLKEIAAAVAGQLDKSPRPFASDPAKVLPVPSERYWIKVFDRQLRPVYQSELAKAVDLPLRWGKEKKAYSVGVRFPSRRIDLAQDKADNVTFRVRTTTKHIAGSPYLVQIARPMEDLQEEAVELLTAIGIGLAVSTILLLGWSYLLTGRIVKPIAAINRLARDIDENTLDQRIPTGRSRDEIHVLATRASTRCSTGCSIPLPVRSSFLPTPPMSSKALLPC